MRETHIRAFYQKFTIEHEAFSQQIEGFDDRESRERYAQLTLLRLIFLSFLRRTGTSHWFDSALSPEQQFTDALQKNPDLFEPHPLESGGTQVRIPQRAMTRVISFLDHYQWRLDDQSSAAKNEIGPEILPYIFEQSLNSRRTGAYYTKDDIAEYIAERTILPYLLRETLNDPSLNGEGMAMIRERLRSDPGRYIFPEIQHGAIDPRGERYEIPLEIAAGLHDVRQRKRWNENVDAKYGPPTETWRDFLARRDRCLQLRSKLQDGELDAIDDFITWNLDIRRLVLDLIERTENPVLVNVLYGLLAGSSRKGRSRRGIAVLDPMCGGGAFLFAALHVLQPLYRACLDRMRSFLAGPNSAVRRSCASEFRRVLDSCDAAPCPDLYIVRSIIENNLYGVDAMGEAVELCKLRLYLKLIAQVSGPGTSQSIGATTAPKIEFNVRTGNALIGFLESSEHRNGSREGLDRRLFAEYAGEENEQRFERWRNIHQPFHWGAEYFVAMQAGGFDVVLGNPPYLETREVEYALKGFQTLESGAIHAMCMERGLQLLQPKGYIGMIVPLAVVCTQRMKIVQEVLEKRRDVWYANYSWRPGKLFDGVNRALTIFLASPSFRGKTFSTKYQKWNSENRSALMKHLAYVQIPRARRAHWAPKCGEPVELSLLEKCMSVSTTVGDFIEASDHKIYYRTTGGLYWKVFTDFAPAFTVNGVEGKSTRETWFTIDAAENVSAMIAALSSTTFWWWYTLTSTLRDLNPADIRFFPLHTLALQDAALRSLGRAYVEDLKRNSVMLVRNQRQTGRTETQTFKIQNSKAIIDQIDRVLAKHYDFTDEETDFIINYDIKFRMGLSREKNVFA